MQHINYFRNQRIQHQVSPPQHPPYWRRSTVLTLAVSSALAFAISACSSPAQAKPKQHTAKHSNSSASSKTVTSTGPERRNPIPLTERQDVRAFAAETAKLSGMTEQQVLAALERAKYQPAAAKAILPPVDPGVKNWQRYRARFLDDRRIQQGVAFWRQHEGMLKSAEQRYGVPAAIIVAIIGVETFYGQHMGSFRTLDALATLAFDYPPAKRDRSAFFRQELQAYFQLCQQASLPLEEVRGSFAGAIGLGQFMPSSWLKFAVDGNGDGRIDLFHNREDAIHSVGNFLQQHGWQTGGRWVAQATITDELAAQALIDNDVIPKFNATQLQQNGVYSREIQQSQELFALIDLPNLEPVGSDRAAQPTEYRLGPQNFYVVTRYNRSSFYALSVIELAQAIKAEFQP